MNSETKQIFDKYVIPSYGRLPLSFVKGKGAWLYSEDGTKYLDMYPGWGVNILGHCHPEIVDAIREQAGKLMHAPNNYYAPLQGQLAQKIIEKSFAGKVFFGNSGAEANEGAIKLARRWGVPQGKYKIITMQDSFHGRTLATLSATGQPKYQEGFGPLVPGFSHVPFGDVQALEAQVDDQTCAIMVEPIQGEGGVNVAPPAYFKELRRICDKNDTLLIFDEVQTGVARTGKWFGFENTGIQPDIMTLAKALGGGVPIGALVASEKVQDILQPGTHASTFGGNPLVCAAALAVFDVIEKDNGLACACNLQNIFRQKTLELCEKYSIIKEYRGAGTMFGLELTIPGQAIVDFCQERNVLINCTHGHVLRFLTSIFLTEEEIDLAFATLDDAFKSIV